MMTKRHLTWPRFAKIGALTASAALLFACAETAESPSTEETATSSAGFGTHGVTQVAYTTSDLERSKAFYSEALGLDFLFETNDMAFYQIGSTRLMISEDENRPDSANLAIVYLNSPDFQRDLEHIRQAGVTLVGPVEAVQSTTEGVLRLQQFEDPDGNMLAIMGTVPHNN